jgi:hypothetical protein
MTIYGKVKAQTQKAILFHIFDQAGELPAEFQDQEIWFPLSQTIGGAQRHTDGTRDLMFAPQMMTVSPWIMQQKATQLGCDWKAFIAQQEVA